MKAVLMSIKPEECSLIMGGGKDTIEQTMRPKLYLPFTVYMFCTGGFEYNHPHGPKTWAEAGKVIGSFVCDSITIAENILWHISDPIVFKDPLPLHFFSPPSPAPDDLSCDGCRFYNISEDMCERPGIYSAPGSWCYVEYVG